MRRVGHTTSGRSSRAVARLRQTLRFDDTADVLGATERLASVTMLMSSVELLTTRENRAFGGLNDWTQLRDGTPPHLRFLRRHADRLYRGRGVDAIHAVRIASTLVTLLPIRHHGLRTAAGVVSVGTSLVVAPVHNNGGDGSDQASFATLAAATLARMSRSPSVQKAAIWSIAGQAVLAYLTSGWVKMLGEAWRSNEALTGVMRTRTYGAEPVWRLLNRHPTLSRAGEVGTLVIECAYPVVYLLSPRHRLAYITGIVGMHLSIAVTMGLGRFVPAFVSLQPAVLYTAGQVRSRNGVDSGHFLPALTTIATGTVLAGAALRIRDERRSRCPGDGQHMIEMGSGNRLAVRYLDHPDPNAPLIVFENSLLATQEYWDPVAGHLRDDFAILTYNRPGYGASSGSSTVLESYVDDLNALIARFRGGRDVWGVGHSLGGYLLWSRRDVLDPAVRGLVLLDPTVDSESAEGARLAERGEPIARSLRTVATSLRTGWGMFLNPEIWQIPALGDEQPARMSSIYRNDRIWRSGIEEWQSALIDLDRPATEKTTDHHLVVVSATGVAMTRDVNAESHRDLAESAGGEHVSLRATHDGLLVHPKPAEAVAEIVARAAGRGVAS